MSRSERLDLDWIRGAAALAVVALHAREIGWVGLRDFAAHQAARDLVDLGLAYLFAPLVWGSAGVAVFFVLSGYVIHASAATKIHENRQWRLDVGDFYLRRFARIYTVLPVALVLTFLLDSVSARFAPGHPNLGSLSPTALVANLLALQGSLFRSYGSNGPLWTLAIEIHFYAMYPLLLWARRHVGAGALLAAGAALSIGSLVLFRRGNVEFFTSYYACWLLGFYAAELRARNAAPIPAKLLPLLATCAAAAGCAVFFFSLHVALLAWSLASFFHLLLLFRKPPARGAIVRGLAVVGTFSYTLYAVHEPVVVFLVAVLNGGMKSVSMLVPLGIAVTVVAVAYLLYRLFERRSIEWLAARGSMGRGRYAHGGHEGR